jgi:hypothetical protein
MRALFPPREPITLSPTLEQMDAANGASIPDSSVRHDARYAWYIELTRLGHIQMPFGEAYLWVICEWAGGYFSKTDYLSRGTHFETERCAREFLEVFPFIQGHVIQGLAPERRSFSNSFERYVLFHLWSHGVFSHFSKGIELWTTQLSGLLQAKSQASGLPSHSMESKCPTKSRSGLKPEASSFCEPLDSLQMSLW